MLGIIYYLYNKYYGVENHEEMLLTPQREDENNYHIITPTSYDRLERLMRDAPTLRFPWSSEVQTAEIDQGTSTNTDLVLKTPIREDSRKKETREKLLSVGNDNIIEQQTALVNFGEPTSTQQYDVSQNFDSSIECTGREELFSQLPFFENDTIIEQETVLGNITESTSTQSYDNSDPFIEYSEREEPLSESLSVENDNILEQRAVLINFREPTPTQQNDVSLNTPALETVRDYERTPETVWGLPTVIRNNLSLLKYWQRRYHLFQRYNEGIILDEESWYSVCPEILANHIASICSFGVGIDPFCGAGGNTIALAKTCNKVIALDIDPKKIELARNNARVYGVAEKITFVVGDFFVVGRNYKADVVVTSPPWGDPKYLRHAAYDLNDLCPDQGGGRAVLDICQEIAPRLALHLPKNVDQIKFLHYGVEWTRRGRVALHDCYVDGRHSITAFYGDFRQNVTRPDVRDWISKPFIKSVRLTSNVPSMNTNRNS